MSTKRTVLYLFGGLLLVASCKTEKTSTSFWQKKLQGREIVEVNDKDYKHYLSGGKDGVVSVWLETRRGEPKNISSLNTSIKTSEKTKVIIGNETFDLAASQVSGYQVFSSLDNDRERHHDISTAFGKDVTVKIEIGAQSPLVTTLYSPAPLQVTAPLPSGKYPPYDVTAETEIKWVPDPRQQNGILLEVHEMTNPNTKTGEWPQGVRHMLLTPDDGALAIKDLLPYLPKNGNYFYIRLNRFAQKTIKADGREYSIQVSATEDVAYKLMQ